MSNYEEFFAPLELISWTHLCCVVLSCFLTHSKASFDSESCILFKFFFNQLGINLFCGIEGRI